MSVVCECYDFEGSSVTVSDDCVSPSGCRCVGTSVVPVSYLCCVESVVSECIAVDRGGCVSVDLAGHWSAWERCDVAAETAADGSIVLTCVVKFDPEMLWSE